MKKIVQLLIVLFCNQLIAQNDGIDYKMNLANQYLKGYSQELNPVKAFNLYFECAKAGNPQAMNNVAMMFRTGKGTVKNEVKAFEWFKEAAKKGYPQAWSNLGMMYKNGIGCNVDYNQAFICYSNAADANIPAGWYSKGYMLYKGLGCNQNYQAAIIAFRNGVKLGNSGCMYLLGLCMRNGYGIQQDLDSAYILLSKAKNLGYNYANDELNTKQQENISLHGTLLKEIVEAKKIASSISKELNVYKKIKTTVNSNEIGGIYEGYLLRYDYSGEYIIEANKLKINLEVINKLVNGIWNENDSITLPINANINLQGIEFVNMNYGKPSFYNNNKALAFDFKNANLEKVKGTNNQEYLMGDIAFYHVKGNEPSSPVKIILQQTQKSKQPNEEIEIVALEKDIQLKAFPVPFNQNITVQFNLLQEANVSLQLFSIDGKLAYSLPNTNLSKGKYNIMLQPNVTAGNYILKLAYGKNSKTLMVTKN